VKKIPSPLLRPLWISDANRDALAAQFHNTPEVVGSEKPVVIEKHQRRKWDTPDHVMSHSEKLPWIHAKSSCDFVNIQKADISFAAFDAADVCAIKVAS